MAIRKTKWQCKLYNFIYCKLYKGDLKKSPEEFSLIVNKLVIKSHPRVKDITYFWIRFWINFARNTRKKNFFELWWRFYYSVMKTHFNSQKVEPTFISQSLGYHCLGAAWGPVEQHSFRWLDPHAGEGLRVPQRPLNGLLQFELHLLHPTYIRPANLELRNKLRIN